MISAPNMGLDQAEAFARIQLLRSPNVGPVTYQQLLRRFGNAQLALEHLPSMTASRGKTYGMVPRQVVETEIAATRKAGARYLFHDSPDYPPLLREIESAPPILIVRGDASVLHRPCVAIVGARNASAAAIKLAREFSQELSAQGFTIVSGLARGIDGAAHRGALLGQDAGQGGGTVGVIASGIDVVYPPEHWDLQQEVATRGILMAEQPPGTEPLARHFPSRNRIIAGMAAGTVVVEAAPKSGSLITARLAGEAGREVMAIPGSPLDPRSHGCNQLIRDGAILVQSPDDVMELIQSFTGGARPFLREAASHFEAGLSEEDAYENTDAADVSELLTIAPVGVDELIRQSGESASKVQLALLEMELAGQLTRHAGGRVSLASG